MKVTFTSESVQQEVVGASVEFLFTILHRKNHLPPSPPSEEDLNVTALRTLSCVLYENGAACIKLHPQILSVLIPLGTSPVQRDEDLEARRMALTCLGNLCVKTGAKATNLQKQVLGVLMGNLHVDVSDEARLKVVSAALRGIQLLTNENKAVVQEDVSALLQLVQKYGLLPLSLGAVPNAASKQHSKRPQVLPSDSEMSEGENGLPRNRHVDNRLQLNSLLCLQSLAKAHTKQVFPYWFRFLPDPVEGPHAPSLISVMRDSESPKIRHAACAALMAFLDGSRTYLSVAEDSADNRNAAFISLSVKLAEQLREIHTGLLKCVREESWPLLVTQEMKCLAVLIRNCPYDRLRHNYRHDAYIAVRDRITHEDFGITSASFEVISALLDAHMPLPASSPLLETLFEYLNRDEHIYVRVAALDVFCAVARNCVEVFGTIWPRLIKAMEESLEDPKEAVRAAAYKVIEQYAHSCSTADESVMTQDPTFWLHLLDTYAHTGIRDPFYAVRTLAVDCLGHIPSSIFSSLPPKRQYACLALALGTVQDDDHNVRAAACRTLGVYVGFRAVQEDVLFLTDVATTIPGLMGDANVGVRVRASWALANLGDALTKVSELHTQREQQIASSPPPISDIQQPNTLAESGLTPALLTTLLHSSLLAAKDNEKCKSNGTRALGNIIRVCPPHLLAREQHGLMKDVISVVLKNVETGLAKTRWNACYALSNILRTPGLPLFPPTATSTTPVSPYTNPSASASSTLLSTIYTTLTKTLLTSKNYKVRIAAAHAMTAPPGRVEAYGGGEVVRGLMGACVRAAGAVEDLEGVGFGEVRYREVLGGQIRTTFTHLLRVLEGDAITAAADVSPSHTESPPASTLSISISPPPQLQQQQQLRSDDPEVAEMCRQLDALTVPTPPPPPPTITAP
ncbi:armadillo-type protein [Fimicolochytrium jonesii]|uniref:armadillo-type protein n=1 Tax=Fimicolochytrium jonesii TaxID=1396493 RepID=UPI0022FDC69C|nr:armadillo-type protein [Fimicolochytrium jonesii]KAI8820256.1 armadillo-type protein [Fimicolochytrium jonesii]